jgi:hypothetical protein
LIGFKQHPPQVCQAWYDPPPLAFEKKNFRVFCRFLAKFVREKRVFYDPLPVFWAKLGIFYDPPTGFLDKLGIFYDPPTGFLAKLGIFYDPPTGFLATFHAPVILSILTKPSILRKATECFTYSANNCWHTYRIYLV